MSQTLFEKLQLKDEKTLLIQGLPSSIEKQFSKLSFAKSVTPLLRTRKIDFALIFAINVNQLNAILHDVMPALKPDSKFWVAYPKVTSKIVTDLNRDCSWNKLLLAGYESIEMVALDHVWSAMNFKKLEHIKSRVRGTTLESIASQIDNMDFGHTVEKKKRLVTKELANP